MLYPVPDQRLPELPGHRVFGNALQYARDPLAFFVRCRDMGDVGRVRFFQAPMLVLSGAEAVDHVLVSSGRTYAKDEWQRQLAPELLGSGLVMSDGELWKRQRRMMQPAFHKDRIAAYGRTMVARALAWRERSRPGEARDVYRDMTALTLDIAGRTLFSADVADQADRVGRALEAVMERVNRVSASVIRLPAWLPTPGAIRYRAAIAALDAVTEGLIRERRARGGGGEDLLGMLLEARDEDGSGMADRQLRDEVVTLMTAGHETTAIALTMTLWLLGRHPAEEAAVREELARVLGGREPAVEDLPSLPRTERVVKEALRLYPPVWGLSRVAKVNDRLGEWFVPAGTMVAMAQWAIHRDPRFFEEPEAFRPGRWTPEFEHQLPRGAYFPFGGGPRLCIGAAFGMMEARLVLAALLQRFRFEPITEKVELLPAITARPKHPMRMVLRAA